MSGAAHREQGDTLVELLLSVVILGIAVTALLGLLRLSVTASGLHHRQTIAGTILDDFAEYMGSQTTNPYAACPGATTTYNSVVSTFVSALSNSSSKYYQPEFQQGSQPAQYSLSVVVDGGQPGTPDANGVADPSVVFPSGCTTDNGLEQLTLSVAANGAPINETVSIVKRQP